MMAGRERVKVFRCFFGDPGSGLRTAKLVAVALAAVVVSIFFFVQNGIAVEPDEVLADPALEARARDLSANLRCLVCQNQSIDDSNAALAHDLRLLVRERLQAGDSDDEVISFLVSRYGEFVLLRPAFGVHTLVLWLAPVGVLSLALYLAFGIWRRHAGARTGVSDEDAVLSAAEEEQLHELLSGTAGASVDGDGTADS